MAMYENSMKIDEEVIRLTEELTKLEPTSAEYKSVMTALDTLYKLRNKQYETELNDNLKRELSDAELRVKEKEITEKAREADMLDEQKKAELAIRKEELEFAQKQHADEMAEKKTQRKHDIVNTGLKVASDVLKTGVVVGITMAALKQGYEFEKDGTPTSVTFREGRKSLFDVLKSLFR